MSCPSSKRWFILGIFCLLTLCGCASFDPRPMEQVPFRERAQTRYENNVRVSAAVPSAAESRALFDIDLYRKGIQPIWLEIENNDEEPVWFFPVSVDMDPFGPIEVSYMNHFQYAMSANDAMDRYFHERGQGMYIGPGSTRSGFIFTNLDEGTKEFNVDLIGEDRQVRTLTFFINVPGLLVDHHRVSFDTLYSEQKTISYNEKGLRKALERLPCCTADKNGKALGDPLNLVVIANEEDLFHAFIRSGWDETEIIYRTSAWKTGLSFLFGGRYRYSPVSALYVYGRSQDIALQKARETIHERNHLRLWLSPIRVDGKPVWVGQISRDIGVRFTLKKIVTHKIDPDVDETRDYLLQDLWYSQGLQKFAYVNGVGPAPMSGPRQNLTGDPYFTDGYRVVLWVSSDPTKFGDVQFLRWETLTQR